MTQHEDCVTTINCDCEVSFSYYEPESISVLSVGDLFRWRGLYS